MGPFDALKTGFAKSFQFKGRASRSEFWWFAALLACVALVLLVPFTSFFTTITSDVLTTKTSAVTGETTQSFERQTRWHFYVINWNVMSLLIAGGFYLLISAVTARRLHDVGSKAAFGFAMLLTGPLLSILAYAIVLLLLNISPGLAVLAGTVVGLLAWLAMFICPIVLLILLTRPSEEGPTEFGSNPHEVPS